MSDPEEPRSAYKAYKKSGVIKPKLNPIKVKLFSETSKKLKKRNADETQTQTPSKIMKKEKITTSTPKLHKKSKKINIKSLENGIVKEKSAENILQSFLNVVKNEYTDVNKTLNEDHKNDIMKLTLKSNETNGKQQKKLKTIKSETNKVTKKRSPKANKQKISSLKKNMDLSLSECENKLIKYKIPIPDNKPNNQTTQIIENISLITCAPFNNKSNSIKVGESMFEWLITPVTINKFFENYWEKSPLLVRRINLRNYLSKLLSMNKIDKMLRNNNIEFTKNIDITSYENGERQTHNPEGRALSPVVWDYYNNGCSIRLLNPQTFIPQIHTLNATLQEYFQCMVGANVYLTPQNSQGFAPHYDDIEAFVLQIEGKKHWKLYKPRTENENLARFSSGNFKQNEIGEPFLDVILEAGDVLYFPRGTIHQASTVEDNHSLHITLSVYQKNSWGDLMELLIPQALNNAIENDIEFRRGLPLNIGQNIGLVYSDQPSKMREEVLNKVKILFNKVFNYIQLDDGVDGMCKKFQWDSMPPDMTKEEKMCTVFGVEPIIEDGLVSSTFKIMPNTNIRLLRANILRMVREGDKIIIYNSFENSKEYHEFEPASIEIDGDDAPAVEYLIRAYPEYSPVHSMPIDNPERRIIVITDLWERGLIMTDNPVNPVFSVNSVA